MPPAPPAAPTVLPAAWASAADARTPDAEALARWWQQFGLPELDALVERALARNTDLRMARARLQAAQAARVATEAATGPQLGLSASSSRSQVDGSGASRLHKLGFAASWEPDLNGAQGAGVTAAQADEFGARADLAATRMSLVAELGLAYAQWRGAQAREEITRASLASLEETQATVRWSAQAGLASALDLQQAVLNTEQTRAGLPALATEIAQYRHQIALLTGQTPTELAGALSEHGAVPVAPAALQALAVGVPADLLRRRPDLRSAEAAVQAAWSRREQTRRADWPGLTLSGTLGLQAVTLAGLGQPGAALATLAAGVDMPVFDGGQRQALVAQGDASLSLSQASYDAAVLGAVKDVEDSLVALRGSRDRSTALQLAAEAADHAMQLSRLQRQAGLSDFPTLLTAQRTALSALLALQTARTEQTLQLIRTWKALGGGWSAADLQPLSLLPAASADAAAR